MNDSSSPHSNDASAPKEKEVKAVVTAEAVINYMRDKIRNGQVVPGQRLVEADIMRETNASRGRVRSALQRLMADGFVVIEEYRGASVKRHTREEVLHIYNVREMLEGLAARTVAESADPEMLEQLTELQSKMNVCQDEGNNRDFADFNEEWHTLIMGASRNAYISEFMDRLRVPTFRLQFKMFYEDKVVLEANEDHRLVTKYILEGNAQEAEQQMRIHVRNAFNNLNKMGDEFFA